MGESPEPSLLNETSPGKAERRRQSLLTRQGGGGKTLKGVIHAAGNTSSARKPPIGAVLSVSAPP